MSRGVGRRLGGIALANCVVVTRVGGWSLVAKGVEGLGGGRRPAWVQMGGAGMSRAFSPLGVGVSGT